MHENITLYRNKLEDVNKLYYLSATLSKDVSCETEIKIILYIATSAMIRLYTIWNRKHFNFKLKYNLYRSLVLSLLTYGCEIFIINSGIYKQNQSIRKQVLHETARDTNYNYQERNSNEYVKHIMYSMMKEYVNEDPRKSNE